MNDDVLNSWKEIAAYLGRGIRTVQRWEQELGLPVRRPRGKERSAVIALKPDVDFWLYNTPRGMVVMPIHRFERRPSTHPKTERLIMLTREILERSTRLQEKVKSTLALTAQLREQQIESLRSRGAKKQQVVATGAVELTLDSIGSATVKPLAPQVKPAAKAHHA